MSASAAAHSSESRYGAGSYAGTSARYLRVIGELDSYESAGRLRAFKDSTGLLLFETWTHKIEISGSAEGFYDGMIVEGIGYQRLPGRFKLWHPFGEEGGEPPVLRKLENGTWRLEGGTYYVAAEGIRN